MDNIRNDDRKEEREEEVWDRIHVYVSAPKYRESELASNAAHPSSESISNQVSTPSPSSSSHSTSNPSSSSTTSSPGGAPSFGSLPRYLPEVNRLRGLRNDFTGLREWFSGVRPQIP
jgi:hypothetical protein